MVFRDWNPAIEYFTDRHDLADDFYRPCLRDAIRYDRITGYFSSAIYLIVWAEIVDFASRGGRIRIICSPMLSDADAKSITEAYRALTSDELAASLLAEYHDLLSHPDLSEPAKALAGLIVDRVVDIRIAQVSPTAMVSSKSMFHDKTGLFFDDNEDAIGFRGGVNDTYLGFATGGNVDSIDVWTSWEGDREAERIKSNVERFERLWLNQTTGVDVQEVPDVALEEFSRTAREGASWQIKAEQLAARKHILLQPAPTTRISLRFHQQNAIMKWDRSNRVGLLEHATATGKTITAIEGIRLELRAGHHPVVLVPSTVLLDQWVNELRDRLSDLRIRVHPCSGTHSQWTDFLGDWLAPTQGHRVVVSTIATAVKPRFLGQLKDASSRLFIVADEAHRLGAPQAKQLLGVEAATRLGLSATPQRAGDPDGTQELLTYFRGIVDTFTFRDALNAEPPILTPYAYEPLIVALSDDEQGEWDEFSEEIRVLIARHTGSEKQLHEALNLPRVKELQIRRAKVIKKARAKVPLARSVVEKDYKKGQRWLVYCEDREQLNGIVAELTDANLPVTEYHSAMDGDRTTTLDNFAANGGVVVSIRCLDEGVDIPDATHALILASSRNPREFIQRRGRVLRKAPEKQYAQIYDAIVVPRPGSETSGRSLILGELARAAEFANNAFTRAAFGTLDQAIANAGVTLADCDIRGGFEPDDDGD